MARKFLYIVLFLIVIVIAGAFALSIWSKEATKFAFTPRGEFVEQDALALNAYEDPDMWYSRPGIGLNDPARYQPTGGAPAGGTVTTAPRGPSPDNPAAEGSLAGDAAPPPVLSAGAEDGTDAPPFAVFFVHPTSYIPTGVGDDLQWNAALGNADAEARAALFIRGMASPFNRAEEIWAPRYRQAVAGAFLDDREEATRAIDAAYRDVALAFDYFVDSVPEGRPIVLAGHSQGALHILTLLQDKVRGTPLQDRIAAVYAIGWPISVAHDLPELGVPACAAAGQPGCVMSYLSFADDGDPDLIMERYSTTPGFDGQARGSTAPLCVNPLTGSVDGRAGPDRNLGTLFPNDDMTRGELVAEAVGATCDERGLLLIGSGPEIGPAVLPGGNYHVYDILLFWANLQQDVNLRVAAWARQAS